MTTTQTLVVIKPDGIKRGLVGEIINRFEKRGFKMRGMKMCQVDEDLAKLHYDEHKNKPFFDRVVKYLASGPVVAIILEGPNKLIRMVRSMIGKTFSHDAIPGTIRGDFGYDPYENIIHGSDSEMAAKREIELWFS